MTTHQSDCGDCGDCSMCRQRQDVLVAAVLAGATGVGPWPWARPVTETERRAAVEVGETLRLWQDWPDARGGLRIGIVADVSTTMDPVARCVASLAWVLTVAAFESSRDATWAAVGPVRPVVVAAEEHYVFAPTDDPSLPSQPGRLGRSCRAVARDGVDVAPSIARGVSTATRAAHLHRSSAARLLVLITDRRPRPAALRGLRHLFLQGCGILTVCPSRAGVERNDTEDTAAEAAADGRAALGDVVPGAVAHVVDPDVPLPGRSLALAALDALHRADRTRTL